MNNLLLIFFALPLATIIIAVVLERIWKCYKLVTAFIFAIYLIVTFAVFGAEFLIVALIYTLLAFIASYLSMLARKISRRFAENNSCCGNGPSNELLTINTNCTGNTEEDNNCSCNDNSQDVAITARITPNTSNNGRTGNFRGCYRRRCL